MERRRKARHTAYELARQVGKVAVRQRVMIPSAGAADLAFFSDVMLALVNNLLI